jgi:acyl carrier protein
VAALTQEQIVEELGKIIEEVTGIEPSEVTVEKSFVDDLDIDSLSMVEIAVQTEDKYGVKIPDEDLASLKTSRTSSSQAWRRPRRSRVTSMRRGRVSSTARAVSTFSRIPSSRNTTYRSASAAI